MSDWSTAIIVGVLMAAPALIAAVFNYYRNKADIAETYEGIALRSAIECERLRAERNEIRQLYEEAQGEIRSLRRQLNNNE